MKAPPKINYRETEGFNKDFKRLLKKFRTLRDDLKTAKRNAIDMYHLHNVDNLSVVPIPEFHSADIQVFKLKKFACKALKGRGVKSGIRVIYAYHSSSPTVDFIEIYFKGEKENEDRDRVRHYMKSPNDLS
ncbi:MAG: hypothetical protein HY804_05285 [Nitrospinae bacterium]|nr:hypothetical protein [Nitrospinota bacterium]